MLYSRFSLVLLHVVSVVCICQSQSPSSSPPLLPRLGVLTFLPYVCVSISVLQTISSVPFFSLLLHCSRVLIVNTATLWADG